MKKYKLIMLMFRVNSNFKKPALDGNTTINSTVKKGRYYL